MCSSVNIIKPSHWSGFVAEVLFPTDFFNTETNYLDSAAETHAELTEQRSFATDPAFSTKPTGADSHHGHAWFFNSSARSCIVGTDNPPGNGDRSGIVCAVTEPHSGQEASNSVRGGASVQSSGSSRPPRPALLDPDRRDRTLPRMIWFRPAGFPDGPQAW